MVISLCIPCMNRTYDLKKIMASLVKAANASPPVEVMLLDYGSQDDLFRYFFDSGHKFKNENVLSYTYISRDYFHMAHARNLSVLASKGDYVVISSTDIELDESFFAVIREHIEKDAPTWLHFKNETGVITVKRDEFIAAGGFDERFEFYGSEDKDLYLRLLRRGAPHVIMPGKLFHAIRTPDEVKIQNYRLKITKKEMDERGKVFYYENIQNGVLVANPEGWGAWT